MFVNQSNQFSNSQQSNRASNIQYNKPRNHYPSSSYHHRRPHTYNRNASTLSNSTGFSSEFWCETCDRGFKTDALLQTHISEHQKCGIDGCKFVGHPNVVTKHIQMQHSTGLYNRIKNLESKEDIQKWIEERKKNYPNKNTIEQKKQVQKECVNRGEKLRKTNNRFNNQNFKDRKIGNRFKQYTPNIKKTFRAQKINTNKIVCQNETTYCGIMSFKGISEMELQDVLEEGLSPNQSIDIEDMEWEEKLSKPPTNENTSAINALMAAYESSSDEDESKIINTSVTKCETLLNKNKTESDSDSGPEEVPISKTSTSFSYGESMNDSVLEETSTKNVIKDTSFSYEQSMNDSILEKTSIKKSFTTPLEKSQHENLENSKNNEKQRKEECKKSRRSFTTFQRQLTYYKDRPSTLLEKLLDKEIRHERNVILQCVKYIVENDFFEKPKQHDYTPK